ncbi:citrate lyase subunit beta / citryl-CoA lyase [Asanoa hainanensis]|uniref:Citrate lyase subunit beta / citryl-CoA lyase n=1 Tax=Asanoa hainanensis TaxID=560556 RepID=A0A239MB02_9ACTN|nr:aldolase/citrate lyase family protein [Asanoa hainanensis]SNT39228.1 citrate lyase subunit beta / citryl-CoA lyase [Asanoa hainanensis]
MLLTWLYVPGDRPERFAKAVASGADAVILDLEDAVVPGRKAYARSAVAEFLAVPSPVPVQVRVSEEVELDLAAVAGLPGLGGLRLPKVESAGFVAAVAARVDVPLHPLIESAVGLENAFAIASASAVASLGLGEADLRSDLGVTDDEGLLWARGRVVVAARAAGLPPPAMAVYTDLADTDGLVASCARGRRLGFLGRAAIHPRQLPAIVAGFRPSPAEVDRATALLAAVAGAARQDSGTVVLPDGRFADRAMVAAAQRTVDLAARYR